MRSLRLLPSSPLRGLRGFIASSTLLVLAAACGPQAAKGNPHPGGCNEAGLCQDGGSGLDSTILPPDTLPPPHVLRAIEVLPANPVDFIDNSTPVTQAFTATGLYADSTTADLTAAATFTVEKTALGGFGTGATAATFTSGTTGGFTKIFATADGLQGYTILTLVPRRIDPKTGLPLDFFFIAPYTSATTPTSAILSFGTTIQQADIGFLVDSTGSMGGKIANLQTSLSSLASTIAGKIPSVAMGVSDLRSWPCSPDGWTGDYVWRLDNRIITVMTAAGLSQIQRSINALSAGGGGDGSETDFDSIYSAASGAADMNCDGSGGIIVPAFNPSTAPGGVSGEATGTIGGMGFRTGSLPILVIASDAESHDAQDPADTSFTSIAPYAHGHTDALNAANKIGARVVGIASSCGGADFSPNFAGPSVSCSHEPYSQFIWIAEQTHAVVPVAAFAGACGAGQCCTGQSGAAVAPDSSGNCPLVYEVDSSGSGLGSSISDAITKLVTFGVLNVGTQITGLTTDESMPPVALPAGHTTADFLTPIIASTKGVTPLDSMPAVGSTGTPPGPTSIDTATESFLNVQPGTTVRFTVRAYNDFIMPTGSPQFFKATIQVVGNGSTFLDSRDVYILVPPMAIIH